MENQSKQSASQKIIAAVKSGRLKMRPKWHFILRAVLWLAGIAAAVLAALYFFSLLMFIARETGIWAAPVFGWRGVLIFLASLPWMLVLLVLVFILALEILVRHYAFAYRLPLLYSALAVLLLVVVGGILLAGSPLHRMLSHCPAENEILKIPPPNGNGGPPCGTGVYRDLGPRRFKNIHRGTIENIDGANIILKNRQLENLAVVITKKTRLPFGADLSAGDEIVVVGDWRGDKIEAFGVREIGR